MYDVIISMSACSIVFRTIRKETSLRLIKATNKAKNEKLLDKRLKNSLSYKRRTSE